VAVLPDPWSPRPTRARRAGPRRRLCHRVQCGRATLGRSRRGRRARDPDARSRPGGLRRRDRQPLPATRAGERVDLPRPSGRRGDDHRLGGRRDPDHRGSHDDRGHHSRDRRRGNGDLHEALRPGRGRQRLVLRRRRLAGRGRRSPGRTRDAGRPADRGRLPTAVRSGCRGGHLDGHRHVGERVDGVRHLDRSRRGTGDQRGQDRRRDDPLLRARGGPGAGRDRGVDDRAGLLRRGWRRAV
ncbi:MAG: hypothetical protein AVDCRST_MAG60-1729, partial [uncultured Nocardioides sp.]